MKDNLRNKYRQVIKEFEESINQNHIIKVKNVKIKKDFIIADIHLISTYMKHTEITIYKNCKYIRAELDNGLIRNRQYKSRVTEF